MMLRYPLSYYFNTYRVCNGRTMSDGFTACHGRWTELPGATCKTFQSTSIPFIAKMARASSAMSSNPLVASASIVGPAPERQIPNNPGVVSGVIFDVTSGKPGIWITHYVHMSYEPSRRNIGSKDLPIPYDKVGARDPSLPRRSIRDREGLRRGRW